MSDLYPLAGLIFFLMFTIFILGDIAVNIAEFKCPGFKERYLGGLPRVDDTELPKVEGVVEKTTEQEETIDVEELTKTAWEKTEPGIAGMCDRWKIMQDERGDLISGFFVWACDQTTGIREWQRGAEESIGKITGGIRTLITNISKGFLDTISYVYMIVTAISSPCAGIGVVSSLILFPIVVTLLIFIFRVIRGS